MNKLTYILFAIYIVTSSCGEYQKALKSEDVTKRFELGTTLYEASKYAKAIRLFQPVLPKFRGKPQGEKLMYMYCKAVYETGDYPTASYHMTQFIDIYPKSEKVDELAFLSAKGYYYASPVYTKEQEPTTIAIEKLQAFINRYPNSAYTKNANDLVKELDFKLEKKTFEIAKLYSIIAPGSANPAQEYKAAITGMTNFLLKYPGSVYKEDALFVKYNAAYEMAVNSVLWKKEARLNKAIKAYDFFRKYYKKSKYDVQADEMLTTLNEQLLDMKAKSKEIKP